MARRVLLADNRLADKAGYYNAMLAEVLIDLDSLDGTGFTPTDIDDILKDLPQERDPSAMIGAPADVRRNLSGLNRAEVYAVRRDDPHPARPSRKEVP